MNKPIENNTADQVLIVDDVPANLEVLADFLDEKGFHILVAESGKAALKLAESSQPDVILLDVMMPGMDGFEVCRKLKSSENGLSQVPVIFMTALSDTSDKLKGFEAGAVDYITKPIQQEELLARLRTHLTLRRQQRLIEEQNRMRDRFMQIAAHDLRNPLSSIILGLTHLKETDTEDSAFDGRFHLYRIMMGASESMADIINTFLDIQGMVSGKVDVKSSKVDLSGVIREVVQAHLSMSNAKKISLVYDTPSANFSVKGDVGRVHQVLTNYVCNAIKYSPKQTTVTLKCEKRKGQVRVSIIDEGPGVSPGERDRLFKEFSQLSNKPTGGERSVGLGLWVVKQLVEAQKGRVGADFPDMGGSVFWFELPYNS